MNRGFENCLKAIHHLQQLFKRQYVHINKVVCSLKMKRRGNQEANSSTMNSDNKFSYDVRVHVERLSSNKVNQFQKSSNEENPKSKYSDETQMNKVSEYSDSASSLLKTTGRNLKNCVVALTKYESTQKNLKQNKKDANNSATSYDNKYSHVRVHVQRLSSNKIELLYKSSDNEDNQESKYSNELETKKVSENSDSASSLLKKNHEIIGEYTHIQDNSFVKNCFVSLTDYEVTQTNLKQNKKGTNSGKRKNDKLNLNFQVHVERLSSNSKLKSLQKSDKNEENQENNDPNKSSEIVDKESQCSKSISSELRDHNETVKKPIYRQIQKDNSFTKKTDDLYDFIVSPTSFRPKKRRLKKNKKTNKSHLSFHVFDIPKTTASRQKRKIKPATTRTLNIRKTGRGNKIIKPTVDSKDSQSEDKTLFRQLHINKDSQTDDVFVTVRKSKQVPLEEKEFNFNVQNEASHPITVQNKATNTPMNNVDINKVKETTATPTQVSDQFKEPESDEVSFDGTAYDDHDHSDIEEVPQRVGNKVNIAEDIQRCFGFSEEDTSDSVTPMNNVDINKVKETTATPTQVSDQFKEPESDEVSFDGTAYDDHDHSDIEEVPQRVGNKVNIAEDIQRCFGFSEEDTSDSVIESSVAMNDNVEIKNKEKEIQNYLSDSSIFNSTSVIDSSITGVQENINQKHFSTTTHKTPTKKINIISNITIFPSTSTPTPANVSTKNHKSTDKSKANMSSANGILQDKNTKDLNNENLKVRNILKLRPNANSTMIPYQHDKSGSWRMDDYLIKYNPHFLCLKQNSLPTLDQEMVLDHMFVQSFCEQPNNSVQNKTDAKVQKNGVQSSILDFVRTTGRNETPAEKRLSLFDAEELSPLKVIQKNVTRRIPRMTKRDIFKKRSPRKDKDSDKENVEVKITPKVNRQKHYTSTPLQINNSLNRMDQQKELDIEKNFGFDSELDIDDPKNNENRLKDTMNYKEQKLPTRISFNEIRKVFKNKKKNEHFKESIGQEEDTNNLQSNDSLLSNSPPQATDAPLGLFEDPDLLIVKPTERNYERKRPRRQRLHSRDSESEYSVAGQRKRRKKDIMTVAEQDEFEKWAAAFNSKCKEIEDFALEVE